MHPSTAFWKYLFLSAFMLVLFGSTGVMHDTAFAVCADGSEESDGGCPSDSSAQDDDQNTLTPESPFSAKPETSRSIKLANCTSGEKNCIDIQQGNLTSFEQIGERFIRLLTGTVVLISIFVFMIGGGFWIFSAGNESLVERGKDMMIYSIIGLLLVLGAYVIVKLTQVVLYALGT